MSPVQSVTHVSGPDPRTLEPRVGVEPTTCRLRIGCSTTELPRPLIIKDLFFRFNLCVRFAFQPIRISAARYLALNYERAIYSEPPSASLIGDLSPFHFP